MTDKHVFFCAECKEEFAPNEEAMSAHLAAKHPGTEIVRLSSDRIGWRKVMDEKRLKEIEFKAGHVASPEGAAMVRELVAEARRLRTENEELRKGARLITEPLPADVARLRSEYQKLKDERVAFKASFADKKREWEQVARLQVITECKDAALDACDTAGCGTGCVDAILKIHSRVLEANIEADDD